MNWKVLEDADSGVTYDSVLISREFSVKPKKEHNKNTRLEAGTSRVQLPPHKILNFIRISNT